MADNIMERTALERTIALVERIYDAYQEDVVNNDAAWAMALAEAKRHPFWPGPRDPALGPENKVNPFEVSHG